MYCMNCGTQLPDSAKFCFTCGQKIDVFPKPEAPAEEVEEVIPESVPEVPAEAPAEAPEIVEAPAPEEPEAPEIQPEAEPEPQPEAPEEQPEPAPEPEPEPEIPETPETVEEPAEEAPVEPDTPEEAPDVPPEEPVPEVREEAPAQEVRETPAPAPEAAYNRESAVKEKPKSGLLPKIIVAVAAIAVIIVVLVLVLNNTPNAKITKLINTADSLAVAGQYDEAQAVLDEAYAIQPDNPEIFNERFAVYDMQAKAAMENGDVKTAIGAYTEEVKLVSGFDDEEKQEFNAALNDRLDEMALSALEKEDLDGVETVLKAKQKLIEGYPGPENDLVAIKLTDRISDLAHGWAESGDFEKAIQLLERKYTIVPGLSEETKTEIESYYKQWIEETLAAGAEVEAVRSLRDKLAPAVGKYDDIAEDIERLDAFIESNKLGAEYIEFAQNVLPYLEADDISGAISYTYNNLVTSRSTYYDIYSALHEDNDLSPLVYDAGDKSVGLYVESYSAYLYYGDYVDGQRTGEGMWLSCGGSVLDTSIYYATVNWSNDLPNGTFEAFEFSKSGSDDEYQTVIIRGEVADGLYNGEISREYVGKDMILYGNYDNGFVEILADKDPNGNETQVVAFSRDKKAWLSTANPFAPFLQYGIKGFGE